MSAERPTPRPPEAEQAAREAAARPEGETALPELELKLLRRSEQPINKEGETTRNIEGLRLWNNYTMVTLGGSNQIRIFDEELRPVGDFKPPLNDKSGHIDWKNMKERLKGKVYICKDTHQGDSSGCKISQVPAEIREQAKETLALSISDYVALTNMGTDPFKTSHFRITPDGKYIVFTSDKKELYFAFRTENEAGVVLPPRNWVRVDYDYLGEERPELEKFAGTIASETQGYRQLNDKYSALVTDVGINIVEKDKPASRPVFSDRASSIGRNVAVDPGNSNVVYYCDSTNSPGVVRLNLDGDPATWSPAVAKFPKSYEEVQDLRLDPSGNFFLFYSKDDLVMITKDGLEEVKRVPKMTQVNFDADGNIRAIDKDGHLAVYEPGFGAFAQELDRRRIAKLAAGIDVASIFDVEVARKAETQARAASMEHIKPLRDKYTEEFTKVLDRITTQEGLRQLEAGLAKLHGTLGAQGLKPHETAFVLQGLEDLVLTKEKEFAEKAGRETLVLVKAKLAGGLSIGSIAEARAAMEPVRAQEALLPEDLRREIQAVAEELDQKSLDLFRQHGEEIIKDVRGLVERTRSDMEAFDRKSQMDDWLEFRYPQLKSRLGSLARDCPLEADEAFKAISTARDQLQTLAAEFEDRFKREYAKVREKAAERIGAAIDILEADIDGLVDRLRGKGFSDRGLAEDYLATSEARVALETEIAALSAQDPDAAKELRRALRVRLSNTLTEIERSAFTQVTGKGKQVVMFGDTAFPKWEAKVKELEQRTVDLVFEEDPKTHGPGVKAGDILGDVALVIHTAHGKTDKIRLYEGRQDEDEWRLGLKAFRLPSYLSATEFRKVKKEYSDWMQGARSRLRAELAEKKRALDELYTQRRQSKGKKKEDVNLDQDQAYRERLKSALEDYTAFISEHYVSLLQRVDRIKEEPDIEYTNGKGYVPEWQSHWVMDPQTRRYLEEMAKAFRMQLDLQEGILNLKGHAGSGKDVLMKMFCAKEGGANRPYFGIDCTKWTTEFELSEDVILEAEGGASQTVRVPSAVLNGITTPGAVVYFNEFNAMPEQAQIFLHALMDEKRSLTLKTSSGRVIKADPTVLLASSMNPGYPGTFEPQFATRSRMVSLEVGYPSLTRQPEAGDTNPNPPYDASEALRIARGVDSLTDLTDEASLERNEFVKMWDRYINGIENGAPDPAGTQKFDIDTTLALVQFANTLRAEFIKIFEKGRDARNALPVTQPITGRELRRCAYALSKMKPEEKATADPEKVARDLLGTYFLTHIDKQLDRTKIETALNTWTSKKRVRA